MPQPVRIGRYEVVEVIELDGPMGVTYKAHDPVFGRPVSLKLQTSNLVDSAEVRECFRAVSALQHPAIEAVYELGEHDGRPYIAMEYVQGQPLEQTIRSGVSLSLSEKLGIILQVAKALHHAYDRGIVHHDIEPGNIMLMRDGNVKIVGFDIAYFNVQAMKRTRMIIGTVAYMSPEQLNFQPVDARSAIFSLGVVLYQLLAGKLPFEAASTAEVVLKILRESPAPLSRFGIVKARELQPFVDRLLAKERAERYQNWLKVVEDLDSIRQKLQDQPQLAGS